MGVGAYKKINEIVTTLGCTRLFVALDAALISSEFYAEIQTLLAAAGVQTAVFTDIEPDPSAHTVERAFAACQAHQASAVLAIGGGSTIDVAKAVGILATNGGRIHDYEGIDKFKTAPLALIAVLTGIIVARLGPLIELVTRQRSNCIPSRASRSMFGVSRR